MYQTVASLKTLDPSLQVPDSIAHLISPFTRPQAGLGNPWDSIASTFAPPPASGAPGSAWGSTGTDSGFAIGDAGSYAATGAAVGSVVPGIGTAIGGAIGAGVGLFKSIFGGHDSTGLPRQPVHDSNFANLLTTKWYSLYAGHPPADSDRNWWVRQIMEDGPQRAFVNFSKALKDAQGIDGPSVAAALAAQYGGPYDLGPNSPSSSNAAYSPATGPDYAPGVYRPRPSYPPAVSQAGLLGGMSPTVMLIAGAAIVGAVLLSRRGK